MDAARSRHEGQQTATGGREGPHPGALVDGSAPALVGGVISTTGAGGGAAVGVVAPRATRALTRRGRWETWSPRPLILRTLVALLAAGAWELYVRSKGSYATPTIPSILSALIELPSEDGFWSSLGGTLQSLLIGYALSLVVGVPLGIVMGRVRPIGRIVNVYMTILLSVPLSAVVPIVVIVFGISLRARVAVIILFALPVLVVNVMTGVAKVERALLEMASSFGWGRAGTVRKVIIPAALPEIFVGLRLAAGRAVVGMIVAELIVISVGVGKLIDYYTARFDMASTYAVVVVILAIAALFLLLIRAVERRVLSWRLTIADTTN